MSTPTQTTERNGSITKLRFENACQPLSYSGFLALLESDADFRSQFNALLDSQPKYYHYAQYCRTRSA